MRLWCTSRLVLHVKLVGNGVRPAAWKHSAQRALSDASFRCSCVLVDVPEIVHRYTSTNVVVVFFSRDRYPYTCHS